MNYPGFGYAPRFGPQMAPAGFSSPVGYPMPQMMPQSAPAPISAPGGGGFAVQPVSSREEGLAVIADPMSAGVLMPDLGHGVVYVKRFNPNTGASDFLEFAYVQPVQAVEATVEKSDFVTRKDFEEALAQLRAELSAKPAKGKREAVTDE